MLHYLHLLATGAWRQGGMLAFPKGKRQQQILEAIKSARGDICLDLNLSNIFCYGGFMKITNEKLKTKVTTISLIIAILVAVLALLGAL